MTLLLLVMWGRLAAVVVLPAAGGRGAPCTACHCGPLLFAPLADITTATTTAVLPPAVPTVARGTTATGHYVHPEIHTT